MFLNSQFWFPKGENTVFDSWLVESEVAKGQLWLSCGIVKNYMQTFNCAGTCASNPRIIQE